MEGINSCSHLSNTLNLTSPQTYNRSSGADNSVGSENHINNASQSLRQAPPLVYDFSCSDDVDKPVKRDRQSCIHLDAEFSSDTRAQASAEDSTKTVVSFDQLQHDAEAEISRGKNSREFTKRGLISRSKSENSVKGVKRFKLSRIFTRKSRNKSKKEETIPSEPPAWDEYGFRFKRSANNIGSVDTLKSISSKDGFSIDSGLKNDRRIHEWFSETLDDEPKENYEDTEAFCDGGEKVDVIVKNKMESEPSSDIKLKDEIIKKLEEEKAALNVEKIDLMNALSNIWIEMEDLKNQFAEEKENEKVNKPSMKELETKKVSNGELLSVSKQEQSEIENLRSQIKELNNINEGLVYEREMQNNTVKALQNKLTFLSRERDALSSQVENLLKANDALKDETCNRKADFKTYEKLKEENFTLKTRLDNVQNARLLSEKNQQRTQLENKKLKTSSVKMEEECKTLLRKIKQELKATNKETVAPANRTENLLPLPSERSGPRKIGHHFVQDVESLSDSESYQSDVSVRKIIKRIERSRSTESDINLVGLGRKLWSNSGIRRSVTIGSLNHDKTASSEFLPTKISRFPPSRTTSTDKSKVVPIASEQVRLPPDSKQKNTEVDQMKTFLDLEKSCSELLEKLKELQEKVEIPPVKTKPKEKTPINSDEVQNPAARKQSDSVLYLCLRNLQKENDSLKLDNLNLKTRVDGMQKTKVIDNMTSHREIVTSNQEVTLSEPLEDDIEDDIDFGLFDTFINERLSKAESLASDHDNPVLYDEIDGVRRERPKDSKTDMSSWHRKHSEKLKPRERSRNKEIDSLNNISEDNHFVDDKDFKGTFEGNCRTRTLSLDQSLIHGESTCDTHDVEIKTDQSASTISKLNQSTMDSNDSYKGGKDQRLKVPRRTQSDIKTVRKALSTCRSRERLFTIYYV